MQSIAIARRWFPLRPAQAPQHLVSSATIDALQDLVDRRLSVLCPESAGLPHLLGPSIRYSLLAPGKRLRPLLTMLTAMQCGSDAQISLNAACAAEMVHISSLIFDDLPCMDDAVLRKGQPTNHLAFGEDTAILSAVSLLALAFRTITEDDHLPRDTRVVLVSALSRAIGPGGLVAGQISDLNDRPHDSGIAEIRERNFRKTAALFCACGEAGAIVGGGSEADRAYACSFAEHIGLAFQILDDLKDAILTSLQIGKDVRQDKAKRTVVSALGRTQAHAELLVLIDRARDDAARIGNRHDPLLTFVDRCFPQSTLEALSAG